MSVVPIDFPRLVDSLDRTANDVAAMMRTLDPQTTISGLEWSGAELAAHLVDGVNRYTGFTRGEGGPLPDDVGVANAAGLAGVMSVDMSAQADRFLAGVAEFVPIARAHDGDDAFSWYDMTITWADGVAIFVGDLLVHGLDIARTLGKPWTIAPEDARACGYGVISVVPSFLTPQGQAFTGTFELRLRGGVPITMSFDRGSLTIAQANGQRVDCRLTADPETFLLVSYGRVSQWRAIVRGKLMASGRKPWLGMKFGALLKNP